MAIPSEAVVVNLESYIFWILVCMRTKESFVFLLPRTYNMPSTFNNVHYELVSAIKPLRQKGV
jgi:hypothetical protein